jgi:intein-encoded DNA endonuclease-like protein
MRKQSDNEAIIKEKDYNEVVRLYLETNMPIIDIARNFGAKSKDPVYRVLRENNIDVNHERHSYSNYYIDNTIVDNIYDMYWNQKITKRQIAAQLNISIYIRDQVLREREVKTRQHYANEFDETYFDLIDTNNKAYLLGFLYADGCVNKNNCVSIVLHNKDREILEMFKNELHATNKISEIIRKDGNIHVRITFNSKHMCQSLINLGCVHNKTNTLMFPNLDEKYIWHFIRGFMDGDGCISIKNRVNLKGEVKKYLTIGFVGTKSMMNSLKSIFKVNNKIYLHRNAFHLYISKKEDVLQVGKLIYKDAELFLKRKYNNYLEYLEYINLRNKGVILHE